MNYFFRVLFFGIIFSLTTFLISCNKEDPVPLIAPGFSNQNYTIAENSITGTVVGTLVATSKNSNESLIFEIKDGNLGEPFKIESSTGEIKILNAELIAFKANPSFTLTVEVISSLDANIKSSAEVGINILSLPKIEPQSFSVIENSPVGTVIGNIIATAINPDESLTFAIIDGNDGESFKIDATTGVISVMNTALLDFESIPTFTLTTEVISSLDLELKNSAQITISLLNIVAPPLDDLIAYYPFNSNANDEGVNGFNGIPMGGVLMSNDRLGISNSAYYFDGVDDYIDLGNYNGLDLPSLDKYSFSFWMKPEETGFLGDRVILGKYNSASNNRIFKIGLRADLGDALIYRVYNQGTSTSELVEATFSLKWQHVVVVADGNLIKLYVDNIKIAENTLTVSMSILDPTSLFIGAIVHSNFTPDMFFKGWIDDVAFYSKSLSESEINTLYKE